LPKVVWGGVVVADCEATVVVEGSHYFPPDSVRWEFFQEASHQTICPWRGRATFFDLVSDQRVEQVAAWSYQMPGNEATFIKGWVAFDAIAILRRNILIQW
jgi:uncharacterized protein (DUF427 family)